MTKEDIKSTNNPSGLRFTFPKREKLCRKKAFTYVFEHGESLNLGVLKFFYAFEVPQELLDNSFQVAFAVPKRNFKRAVDRNLLKRRMREAFRLHKHLFVPSLTQSGKNLALIIKYQPRKVKPYFPVEKAMKKGLQRIGKFAEKEG